MENFEYVVFDAVFVRRTVDMELGMSPRNSRGD
jgi:hypothetical protein